MGLFEPAGVGGGIAWNMGWVCRSLFAAGGVGRTELRGVWYALEGGYLCCWPCRWGIFFAFGVHLVGEGRVEAII